MTAAHARELELDTLTVEQDDRVLTVRFCDPPYNFMTARMQKDLDTLTAQWFSPEAYRIGTLPISTSPRLSSV
jgi:16S rRNA G966 N2-methylase RsmD